MTWAAATLVLGLLGCRSGEHPAPVPGTTYRIEAARAEHDEITKIQLFTTRKQCLEARIDDVERCVPWADRASGTVRLAFRFVDPTRPVELVRALHEEELVVEHDGHPQTDWRVVPHDEVSPSQLFVLLIDGSSSMFDNDGARIRAVRDALLRDSVIDAFYPPASGDDRGETGVVVLRFTDSVTSVGDGPPRVLTERDDYERLVDEHLLVQSRGYTHLYEAVRYALGPLMAEPSVAEFVEQRNAAPTIVLMTDGFNNTSPEERCRDNVEPLERIVQEIRTARATTRGSRQPTLFTIGLGRPYGPHFKDADDVFVEGDLCGDHASKRIAALEKVGIDHVSLQWLAEAGGGRSVVQDDSRDLPDVLRAAVPQRYRWYELWMQTPHGYHRSRFEVGVGLHATKATVGLLPHPWLDGPRGRLDPDSGHVRPTPIRHVFAVLVPALGVLLFARYLGPAWFAARRLLLRGRPAGGARRRRRR